MSDQPSAEFLNRLRPIPTYRDHPATSPGDIDGVDPWGAPVQIPIVGSAEPVLLLFLSAACLGCRDLWCGTEALRQCLPAGVRVVLVTRGPEDEDAETIRMLAPGDIVTVMSSQAFRHYRVAGPPFLVVTVGHEVRTEGVAWGIAETARATRNAIVGKP